MPTSQTDLPTVEYPRFVREALEMDRKPTAPLAQAGRAARSHAEPADPEPSDAAEPPYAEPPSYAGEPSYAEPPSYPEAPPYEPAYPVQSYPAPRHAPADPYADEPYAPPTDVVPLLPDQPVKAVWKQAHPSARRWAEQRHTDPLRRSPNPARIMLGLLVAALGAWLLLSFLPDRKPLGKAERAVLEHQAGVDADAWRYPPDLYRVARGLSVLYITLGAVIALRALGYRRHVEARCARCRGVVVAERSGFVLRCPTGRHSAGLGWSTIGLALGFVGLNLGMLVLTLLAHLRHAA